MWRMGGGEGYIDSWDVWFRQLGETEQKAYIAKYPEPENWFGFYQFRLLPPPNMNALIEKYGDNPNDFPEDALTKLYQPRYALVKQIERWRKRYCELHYELALLHEEAGHIEYAIEHMRKVTILIKNDKILGEAQEKEAEQRYADEQGRIALESGEQRFLSRYLVPEGFLSRKQPYSIVVEPLYFRKHQIGFSLFEVGPQEGHIYDILRGEISSALQGALLVQQVQEHAAELARKQYVLDTFMKTVPDRICFKNLEGRITRANKAHAVKIGLNDPTEEIGKTDFDFLPAEQARIIHKQEQEIIRSGVPLINMEEPTMWAGGRVDWSLTTRMPLRDEHGDIIGTFSISRDITTMKQAEEDLKQYREHLQDLVNKRTAELTRINKLLEEEIAERKRAEHALRLSEQQYRLLAENVMDGIVIVQEGKLVFVNAVFAAMAGHPPSRILQRDVVDLFVDQKKQVVHDQPASVEPDPAVTHWQAELVTGTGNPLWVEVSQTPIIWESQPALLLTIRNIHASKLREQRLEQERERLRQENLTFKSTLTERYKFGEIVGKSPPMQQIYSLIVSAAASDVNVLVCGESGTGKELIARTIHQLSARKQQAFVPVNCASIPETLFEREFFGHRKGTFTGASSDRVGLFDRAHRGMLFLDEVTELSPGMQAKLLRVLQDGEYFPVGNVTPKQADALIIAATNKDWKTLIEQGLLRKDFFYRICVIEIRVPPLQERKEDIPRKHSRKILRTSQTIKVGFRKARNVDCRVSGSDCLGKPSSPHGSA